MLNKEEFLRLQKLSAICLNDEETEKLAKQLGTIVDFLGKLKEVPGGNDLNSVNHTLNPISGVNSYPDTTHLFDNSIHAKIGNSIVINSVIDN